ncbi:hypothetical protein KIPE111705_47035 [Kibdelosporangium persicum]|uniref:hypothetical protein n=1 Tax=Kibdelosporangium persicum TaxID=2698649 RepID=UPI001566C0B7|nr:hypothetical protein [Kibdelosporangium persicum]
MITTSLVDRLAGNNLQQHMFASQSTVAQECGKLGATCLFTFACCDGLYCRLYHEWAPDGHCRVG